MRGSGGSGGVVWRRECVRGCVHEVREDERERAVHFIYPAVACLRL